MYQSACAYIRPSPTDPEVTLYTEIDNLDMKGHFPARLMNMALASEAQKEFKTMYLHIRSGIK